MVCFPAIVTAAYFVSIILLDLYNRNWHQVPGRALMGVFAVLLVLFICEKASDVIAWILLGAPFVFVLFGYLATVLFERKQPSSDLPSPDLPSPSDCNECPCCHYQSCRCRRPCWRPTPEPKPEPKPKPDNCIKSSLADE